MFPEKNPRLKGLASGYKVFFNRFVGAGLRYIQSSPSGLKDARRWSVLGVHRRVVAFCLQSYSRAIMCAKPEVGIEGS